MDILLGLFLIIFGLATAFLGIQIFFSILPILGFVFGFFTGAALVHALIGDGFLGTVTGWVVGAIGGIAFAAIAWFWWYAGVLLSSGAAGALVGSGLAQAIGFNSGVSLFIFGLIGAAAFVFVTMALNLPIYMVIVNTAIAGSSVVISGVLLLFNQVNAEDLGYGAASSIIHDSAWWLIVWIALAVVGIGRQLTLKNSVRVPNDRWTTGATAATV